MKTPTLIPFSLVGLLIATAGPLAGQDPQPPPPPPAPPTALEPAVPAPPKAPRPGRATGAVMAGNRSIDMGNAQAFEPNEFARVGDEMAIIRAKTGRSGRALIVPAITADPKMLAETEEDLSVMARVLDKAVGSKRGKGGRAMGIPVDISVFGAPAPVRNLYLEGHGALFFLNVPFPLLPPPPKNENEEPAKKPADSEWDAARSEIYGAGGRGGVIGEVLHDVRVSMGEPQAAPQEYDTNKVERLKKDLIESLMNATHLRWLKPGETVTVVVTGGGGAVTAERWVQKRNFGGGGGGTVIAGGGAGNSVVIQTDGGPAPFKGGESTLVIRAKKADAEAFYNGQSDFDSFLKKVSVLLY